MSEAPLDILVTEVTNMHNGYVCVGGWCELESRMVRPLSGRREHWNESLAKPELFQFGNVVRIVPAGFSSGRGLPHAREDCVVNGHPERIGNVETSDLADALSPSESPSIQKLFNGQMQESRYVMAGSDCASLGAIRTHAQRLGFDERAKPGGIVQLRCWFYDQTDSRYNLPVASRSLQLVQQKGGLDALTEHKAGARTAHVRIGLAHPFDDARAFAMVNHVFFF